MVKRSTLVAVVAAAVVAAVGIAAVLSVTQSAQPAPRTLTVRLWDPQVQKAYDRSFRAFEDANPGVTVRTVLVPWADYFTKMRVDLAAGNADDLFWLNAGNFEDYAQNGDLVDVSSSLGAGVERAWQRSVVEQYTLNGSLWGVPQLADPGIGLLYNAELLKKAGLTANSLTHVRWSPERAKDTLLPVLQKLTLDANGRDAADPGFDPGHVVQYGYNAANDLNALYINFLGSNGAVLQRGNTFAFASAKGEEAIQYLVDLIDKYHVAPPASDTNTNGDFSRDQFMQGRMALFQTGSYNLANVEQGARFDWGIAPMPAGPAGAISVTNGVIVAGNAHSRSPEAVRKLLAWLGSAAGSKDIAADGSASPAVLAAQKSYVSFWSDKGIDIRPLYEVLANGDVQAPQGANWSRAQDAFDPIFQDIFAGRRSVSAGLEAAQEAANAAMESG